MMTWVLMLAALAGAVLMLAEAVRIVAPHIPFRSRLLFTWFLFSAAGALHFAWRVGS